jgi:hypothetical protein
MVLLEFQYGGQIPTNILKGLSAGNFQPTQIQQAPTQQFPVQQQLNRNYPWMLWPTQGNTGG